MKHEWRKHEKALYGAGKTPELLDVPAQKFIVISGRGDPNGEDFSARVSALYPLAYALRSIFKARDEVRFETMTDGRCVQMLHTGSYDGEPASFALMADFAAANGLERAGERHREIYLNNAQRTEPDKLKTILRFSLR